jgi:protein-S-isoprenylcysteine O-methyltransferase Ste14
MNLPTVAAAIGAINSPAEEIRHVRNFYVHRRRGAAQKALSTGHFPHSRHPVVFELTSYASGGKTVIESWIDGLILIATAAAQ